MVLPKVDHRDARTRAWLLASFLLLLPLVGFTHLEVVLIVVDRLLLSCPLHTCELLSLASWVLYSLGLLFSNQVVAKVALSNAILDQSVVFPILVRYLIGHRVQEPFEFILEEAPLLITDRSKSPVSSILIAIFHKVTIFVAYEVQPLPLGQECILTPPPV